MSVHRKRPAPQHDIESEIQPPDPGERRWLRQIDARPMAYVLKGRFIVQQHKVRDCSSIDCSLSRSERRHRQPALGAQGLPRR